MKSIYLTCDSRDLDAVPDLEDYLFDQGFEVIVPIFEGDESEIRLDHQENLKSCDAALIYYGSGNELWLRSKTRDLLKVAGFGRATPLNNKAVYIGSPTNSRKDRFRSHDSVVIKGGEPFDPAVLNDFIQQINQA